MDTPIPSTTTRPPGDISIIPRHDNPASRPARPRRARRDEAVSRAGVASRFPGTEATTAGGVPEGRRWPGGVSDREGRLANPRPNEYIRVTVGIVEEQSSRWNLRDKPDGPDRLTKPRSRPDAPA